ncbi:MAG: hypothetical protein IJD10_05680 [Clostridia bacterium]|nr:hypothetical protein [Clostridia bacterium]
MTNRNTKRALFASVVAMLICVSMLVGTTFAWFTDTEGSGKNIIKSGNLDVELSFYRPEDSNAPADLDDDSIWNDIDGSTEVFDEDALWEPGYTQVVYFRVKNVGSLALKYNLFESIYEEKAGINAANEIFYLSDYLFSYVEMNADTATIEAIDTREAAVNLAVNELGASRVDDLSLLAGETKYGVMIVTMPTTVGNEANHLIGLENQPVIGLGITLVATQEMYEDDSYGDNYDEGATYPKTFEVVSADKLAEALAADNNGEAKVIDLKADVTVDAAMEVVGDVAINTNGNTIASTVAGNRAFKMSDDSTLTVNAEGEIINIGTDGYGVVEVPADVENATVILNGGSYIGSTDNGAFIKVRPGSDNVNITLNEVTYTNAGNSIADGFIINAYDFGGVMNVDINGGTFSSFAGLQIVGEGSKLEMTGATLNVNTVGFEIAGAEATITDCVVRVKNPTSGVGSAPSAAFAVSHNGKMTVENCTVSVAQPSVTHTFAVYSSGGSIVASGNSWSTYEVYGMDTATYPNAAYDVYIEDAHGNVVADING